MTAMASSDFRDWDIELSYNTMYRSSGFPSQLGEKILERKMSYFFAEKSILNFNLSGTDY